MQRQKITLGTGTETVSIHYDCEEGEYFGFDDSMDSLIIPALKAVGYSETVIALCLKDYADTKYKNYKKHLKTVRKIHKI